MTSQPPSMSNHQKLPSGTTSNTPASQLPTPPSMNNDAALRYQQPLSSYDPLAAKSPFSFHTTAGGSYNTTTYQRSPPSLGGLPQPQSRRPPTTVPHDGGEPSTEERTAATFPSAPADEDAESTGVPRTDHSTEQGKHRALAHAPDRRHQRHSPGGGNRPTPPSPLDGQHNFVRGHPQSSAIPMMMAPQGGVGGGGQAPVFYVPMHPQTMMLPYGAGGGGGGGGGAPTMLYPAMTPMMYAPSPHPGSMPGGHGGGMSYATMIPNGGGGPPQMVFASPPHPLMTQPAPAYHLAAAPPQHVAMVPAGGGGPFAQGGGPALVTMPTSSTMAMVPAANPDAPGPKQLIVNYISPRVTESELRSIFEQFGPLEVCRIIYDKFSGATKGFGFVYYFYAEHAQAALVAMNGFEMYGKWLKVSIAVPQRQKDPTTGQYDAPA